MNHLHFEDILSGPISLVNIRKIVDYVDQNPKELERIYGLVSHEEIKISWRAAWACEKLSELHPDWFIPKQDELINTLLDCTHDGKKRIFLSILFNLPLPNPYSVALLDYTLDKMLDPKESIGVQALCIKLAYRLCNIDQDLLYELKVRLQSVDRNNYSKGVNASIKNVLKKL